MPPSEGILRSAEKLRSLNSSTLTGCFSRRSILFSLRLHRSRGLHPTPRIQVLCAEKPNLFGSIVISKPPNIISDSYSICPPLTRLERAISTQQYPRLRSRSYRLYRLDSIYIPICLRHRSESRLHPQRSYPVHISNTRSSNAAFPSLCSLWLTQPTVLSLNFYNYHSK